MVRLSYLFTTFPYRLITSMDPSGYFTVLDPSQWYVTTVPSMRIWMISAPDLYSYLILLSSYLPMSRLRILMEPYLFLRYLR